MNVKRKLRARTDQGGVADLVIDQPCKAETLTIGFADNAPVI
jgi:hypothetical protein